MYIYASVNISLKIPSFLFCFILFGFGCNISFVRDNYESTFRNGIAAGKNKLRDKKIDRSTTKTISIYKKHPYVCDKERILTKERFEKCYIIDCSPKLSKYVKVLLECEIITKTRLYIKNVQKLIAICYCIVWVSRDAQIYGNIDFKICLSMHKKPYKYGRIYFFKKVSDFVFEKSKWHWMGLCLLWTLHK